LRISELTNTIGISREELPRINFDFLENILEKFKNDDIRVRSGTVPVTDLKPCQDKLNNDKIESIVKDGAWEDDRKLFISKDGFIVDGHHYWAANMVKDPSRRLGVYLVDMNIIDLINWFNSSKFSENRKITEGKKHV